MSHDTIVRERLDAVLDRSNIPTWVDQTELRAELFKVVSRMLKAGVPKRIAGKVVLNTQGEKAISFTDADWRALSIGDVIYIEVPQ